ncbi:MAG: toast rack family protein [Bacteroidales bacterium]
MNLFLISCNESNQTRQEHENMDEYSENENDTSSSIQNLEDKMDQIMSEKSDFDGDTYKDVTIIKAAGAKKAEVNLKIGAAHVRLSAGSGELLTAGFKYSNEEWKPEISYDVNENTGYLELKQPENQHYNIDNGDKYSWNLKFTDKLPLDFNIELGAGLSEINLDNLIIDRFSMDIGVGKAEIDLGSNWKRNAEIHLNGGIGLSIIHIPQNVGVSIEISKGLGDVEVRNLKKTGNNKYENDAFSGAGPKIKVYIKTGIGKIEID